MIAGSVRVLLVRVWVPVSVTSPLPPVDQLKVPDPSVLSTCPLVPSAAGRVSVYVCCNCGRCLQRYVVAAVAIGKTEVCLSLKS
jgi:hypothetical protein